MLNVPSREKEKAAVNAPQSKRFANSAAGFAGQTHLLLICPFSL